MMLVSKTISKVRFNSDLIICFLKIRVKADPADLPLLIGEVKLHPAVMFVHFDF
jgi:hypothetical protein